MCIQKCAKYSKAADIRRSVGGRLGGFFHSTGHGLGLEVHESPRLERGKKLKAGNVVTVEP
ncbi:MAG: M24 family metallopeptidase [Bacilli bacterium]